MSKTGKPSTIKAEKKPIKRRGSGKLSTAQPMPDPNGQPNTSTVGFDANMIDLNDPALLAKAQFLAFTDLFDMLTIRANSFNQPPTQIRQVGQSWMICYLQSDGSYGNCRPYSGPV